MKRIIHLAAVFLVAATCAAAAQSATGKPICRFTSIGVTGNRVVAKVVCSLRGRALIPKVSWSMKTADLSGYACGSNSGPGSRIPLPQAAPFGRYSGAKVPAVISASFTAKASWRGQSTRVTKKWSKSTPETHLLCGAPPPLSASPGPGVPTCVWGATPIYTGTFVKATAINCTGGDGKCHWQKLPPVALESYSNVNNQQIVCSAGSVSYVSIVNVMIWYNSTATQNFECTAGFPYISSFNISPTWGPGYIWLELTIDNRDLKGQEYPPGSIWQTGVSGQADGWRPVNGSVDPCAGDLKS